MIADRLLVRTLAYFMRTKGAMVTRCIFDEHYDHYPEQWRREIWSLAAERAESRRIRGAT